MFTSVFLTACSGPIKTRVETLAAAPLSGNASYRFAAQPSPTSSIYQKTQIIVADYLNGHGLSWSEDGSILVQFSIAERPASIGIKGGQENTEREIATAKDRGFLQSCDDVEHRFSVSLLETGKGEMLYRGQAWEYHCRGALADSLSPLVKASFSDLGKGPMQVPRRRTKRRLGID